MNLPNKIELATWPNGSLIGFLEKLKYSVSTYQEDNLIDEVIERLKRQDNIVRDANSRADLIAALENAAAQFDFTAAALAKGQTVSVSSLQNCAANACVAIAKAKGIS